MVILTCATRSVRQLFRRVAGFRGFGPPPPTLRASTAFRTIFVVAGLRAGFAIFVLFPVFALMAVFFAAFDVFTVFELPRAVCFGFAAEMLGRHSRALAISLGIVLVVSFTVSIAFGIA